jgi:hypothetical protein
MLIMPANILEIGIITAEYSGPNRRYVNERRLAVDRRAIIRFDMNGGDRRAGFSRRHTDEGLHGQDFG